MPAPQEVSLASVQYEAFAKALKDRAMLQTHNQVYAMTRAVLHETRDQLLVNPAIRFGQALPIVLRAIYFEGWVPEAPSQLPAVGAKFSDRIIRRLEPHHIPPETIVDDVIASLWSHCDGQALERACQKLPDHLKQLWMSSKPG